MRIIYRTINKTAMNQGIIKISEAFWNDRIIRNAHKKYIRIIKMEPDIYTQGYVIRCKSPNFDKEVKEGYVIPEYILTFKTKKRKSILGFERKDRIVLDNCSLYGE